MSNWIELSPEQCRETINTRQIWDAWLNALKRRSGYAGSMVWRSPERGTEYLVRISEESATGRRREKSLGPRSEVTEKIHADFITNRDAAKESLHRIQTKLQKQARLNRALDLGRVPETTSKILRHLHRENLLGASVVVSGTNALYAYEAAAGVHIESDMLATGDLDIMLDANARLKLTLNGSEPKRIVDILKSADKSFVVLDERHRAVNDDAFFVELIKAEPTPPWKDERDGLGDGDMQAAMIANMRWLASAPKFHAVAIGVDGFPVPIACSDPRAFAIYKLNMGTNDPSRDPVKRIRDVAQAETVAAILSAYLPQLDFTDEQMRFFPKHVFEKGHEALDPFFSHD